MIFCTRQEFAPLPWSSPVSPPCNEDTEPSTHCSWAGDYIRYLDDFQNAAIGWHQAWEGVPMSPRIRNSLLLMHEYTCLYVNAFSFQAILTRATSRNRAQETSHERRGSVADPFPQGIMPTPEGRYVFDAIMAAKRILGLLGRMNPVEELRFLPSRYYL